MALLKLKIPAGAVRIGTPYQAKGRWHGTNLVRWLRTVDPVEGPVDSLRPIGGWTRWGTGTFDGLARGAYAWTDASGNRWFAFGTASHLYVANSAAAVFDITPSSGFTAGAAHASLDVGYGKGPYGAGPYGTARPDTGAVTLAGTWALDGWGQYLVGCMDGDGDIWEWQLATGTPAAQVANAPTGCIGLVVTQERFLFALGAGGDPRKVQWCDQAANTVWTPAATNQAGSFILETDGEIRCGIKSPSETLILTSTDLWSARYVGYPLVYSFRRVDTGCGALGNRTAVRIGNRAVWLGRGGFYLYDGLVRKLRCDVWELYEERLATVQASKIFGWHNSEHSEACWLIPSGVSNECDFYIVWNYAEDWWAFCDESAFPRTCGVGRGTFQNPVLCGTDGVLYQHEIGTSFGAAIPYAESGPIELGNGEHWMHATQLYPDEKTLGQTDLTFLTRPYPTADETEHGPYSMENPTSVRFGGRQVRMMVRAGGYTDWRFGVPRLEVVAGGKR